jgi:hypothetical protein
VFASQTSNLNFILIDCEGKGKVVLDPKYMESQARRRNIYEI